MALPPGPKIPAVVQTLELSVRPFTLLRRCAEHFGDPFTIKIVGNRIYVIVSDPATIREIFAGLNGIDPIGIGNDELRPALGDHSLLLLDGAEHKRHRKVLAPPFSSNSVPAYRDLIHRITERLSSGWQQGATIPIYDAMQEIALEVILSIVFGTNMGSRLEEFKTGVSNFMHCVSGPVGYFPALQKDLGPWSPGGKVLRTKRELDKLIFDEITRRRQAQNGKGNGVISALLNAGEVGEEPFSDQEIHDELITLILAGHDPTTAALAWAMYWIHQDLSIARKLREEMSETAPDRPEDWAYLDAIVNETLRIHPMFPTVERKMRVPVKIMGYVIDPGVRITPCVYLMHHRPELFPEPERFRPERFLERRYAPYEFFPFGGGSRRCIGAHFAHYQMKVILSSLLRRYSFEALNEGKVRAVLRGASIGPSGPVRMRVAATHSVM
jgi:cytochrome P450 family 110